MYQFFVFLVRFQKLNRIEKSYIFKEICNGTSFIPGKIDRKISLKSQIGSFVSVARNNQGHLLRIYNCKESQN